LYKSRAKALLPETRVFRSFPAKIILGVRLAPRRLIIKRNPINRYLSFIISPLSILKKNLKPLKL
jgi:hypothetical protein